MQHFAFISRHEPTSHQKALAEEQGIALEPIGDSDAFTITPGFIYDHGSFEGVVVVHPAAAMRLASGFLIGVFENSNRAMIGEPPKFEALALHVFDLRD